MMAAPTKETRDAMYATLLEAAKTEIYGGLDPVDLRRCQAEYKIPQNPFKLGDPPARWQRCDRPPVTVAVEAKPDPITKTRGAMALCRSCGVTCKEKRPGEIYAEAAPFKAAFRLGGHQAVWDMVQKMPEP